MEWRWQVSKLDVVAAAVVVVGVVQTRACFVCGEERG